MEVTFIHHFEANLLKTIALFARASDLNDLRFLNHSKRVTYISFCLGLKLGLDVEAFDELVQSALLHDIGIMTEAEQLELADLAPTANQTLPHCLKGYQLLLPTRLFGSLAQNILEHHDFASPTLRTIPAILHVADRLDIILDKDEYALWQKRKIIDYFQSKKGLDFSPIVVDALEELAEKPSFWLDLHYNNYRSLQSNYDFQQKLSIEDLEEIAEIMAALVDSKSPFTYCHSQGVATVVSFLAHKLNFEPLVVRLLYIAGLLHDIGKLAIPEEILLYPGALNKEQRKIMQQHTYHTYHLIANIGPDTQKLAGWAAYHHERLNGTGYPFRLNATKLDKQARLMAVADITQSLLEERPYRPSLSIIQVTQILKNNVELGNIDPELTNLAIQYLPEIQRLVQDSLKNP